MKKILATFSFMLLAYSSAFAWERTGHALVLAVAMQYMDDNAKAVLDKYMNGLSAADAASWMDEIKGDPKYKDLGKLHYINIEKGQTYDPSNKDNIIGEINRILAELASPKSVTDEAIRVDLLELLHLIGDLHQPLHCGYGSDKGGNTYQVQFNGKSVSLHKVWDSQIIDYLEIRLPDVLEAKTDAPGKGIHVTDWLNESRGYVEGLYPPNHKITEEYIKTNGAIIKSQLHSAGIRLAAILNAYSKNLNPNPKFEKENAKEEAVTIGIDDLEKYIGKTVKICTKVYGTKQLTTGSKPTFLNCGADYPKSLLTVVIYESDLGNFRNNPEKYYHKKDICVTGRLVLFKDKPEIIVKNEGQIEVK